MSKKKRGFQMVRWNESKRRGWFVAELENCTFDHRKIVHSSRVWGEWRWWNQRRLDWWELTWDGSITGHAWWMPMARWPTIKISFTVVTVWRVGATNISQLGQSAHACHFKAVRWTGPDQTGLDFHSGAFICWTWSEPDPHFFRPPHALFSAMTPQPCG